ncbi:hypothetical protein JK636_18085 [Clostridium sp. YIM B02515]|uniref:Uncharacterized protein n=1 Tax=Clostridium rhizosphaerae TaxID=2803861 RepID=A0ABS1TI53_9CLOT|nr:hypothetical protein [Clostridium rhizosphaerae]MBL4937628.1 hypothetical protein [Clostridium rhizosphaerae]
MLNLTLTITAAPELLAAMTSFTSAIVSAKMAAIPEYTLDFTEPKASKENAMQVPVQTIHTPIQVPVQTVPTQGVSVPTSAQSFTMEQLAVAATQLVDAGHQAELVRLLSSFGVQTITALSKEQYGAFVTELRSLGAKI